MRDPKSLLVSHDAGSSELPLSSSPPSLSGEHRNRRPASLAPNALASLVMQRHARLAHFNHFEVLEIPESAGRETVRRAFQQAVRRFHPEQLAGEYERLQPLAKEIVCRIGVAYRVLEDDAMRAQYRRSLAQYPHLAAVRSSVPSSRPSHPALRPSSVPSPRSSCPVLRRSSLPAAGASAPSLHTSTSRLPASPSSPVVDLAGPWTAAQAFEAAKVYLQRQAFDEAMAHVEQACIAEPEHAQYRALHAWLRVRRGELTDGPVADEILMTLTWAVRQRRNDLEIRMYHGRVLQRLGRHEEAMRDFSVVASMDETNLEALREVQLHREREEQKAASSGVWARLFKSP